MFGKRQSAEMPKRWIKYIDVVTKEILFQRNLSTYSGPVPTLPCIGAKIKHRGFNGVVVDVFIDYTSDETKVDCDAAVITVNVTFREDVKNEREDLFGFYYSLQTET